MKLRVSSENKVCEESWSEYVENHAEGTIYHHPAYLKVLEENSIGRKLYSSCGFTVEGQLRESVFKDGSFKNEFALLAGSVKQAHPIIGDYP